MNTPKFSIIITCFNRAEKLKRTLKSVESQTFRDFEVVLVDDASSDGSDLVMEQYCDNHSPTKVIIHKIRKERVESQNDGIDAATGEWLCFLDSDDEYMSNYLEILNDAIAINPEYKVFNFGSIIHCHTQPDQFYTKIGEVFKPDLMGGGHISFKSGHIGTGRFIFKRELALEIGLPIPSLRPYGDPGCFPELNRLPEYPMREDGQWVPFGNPWGNDYWWFWKITREHQSMPLDMFLYIEHRRP